MEQVTRIELASPAWKAGALTIVLHLRLPSRKLSAELEYHETMRLSSIQRNSFENFTNFFCGKDLKRPGTKAVHGCRTSDAPGATALPTPEESGVQPPL